MTGPQAGALFRVLEQLSGHGTVGEMFSQKDLNNIIESRAASGDEFTAEEVEGFCEYMFHVATAAAICLLVLNGKLAWQWEDDEPVFRLRSSIEPPPAGEMRVCGRCKQRLHVGLFADQMSMVCSSCLSEIAKMAAAANREGVRSVSLSQLKMK